MLDRMDTQPRPRSLSARDLEALLAVTSKLATPFDLRTMLTEVVDAAKQVLDAGGGSVWLYDPEADELVLEVATDMAPVRVPAGSGLVGSCARQRQIINVPDCYADPRFNRDLDRRSGFHTRCMLTLPLIDHQDVLVGVMQVLNKADGPFDAQDEALATALAAQCAVALQRVRMTQALIEGEKMRQELELARDVQRGTLPATMPLVPGYDLHGAFQPASLTGGDTYDLYRVGDRLLLLLGDATGHGMAPALSVTQMQAMLRMAFRLGAELETAFRHVNNQLAEVLPDDRFITAFIGLLNPEVHQVRFHSGGQGPILHWRPSTGECLHYRPTSFPLAAMPIAQLRPAMDLDLEPGDILALVTDGIFEYENAAGEPFGEARVIEVLRQHHGDSAQALTATLLAAVQAFAAGAPQEDDMTVVMVKRLPGATATRAFPRTIEALDALVAFTAETFAREGVDEGLRGPVDLALEEIFTNMVKYGSGGDPTIRVDLTRIVGGIEATVSDRGSPRFDLTQAPDADTTLPLEQRTPGGLGLHLIRRLVEGLAYEYEEETRHARIRFRKTMTGDVNARH